MSLNHHLPTRECASIAALLPLAGRDLLSEQEAARLQTHLATCAHCRAELALDAHIEAALRRSFAPPEDATPLLSREQITALLSARDGGATSSTAAGSASHRAGDRVGDAALAANGPFWQKNGPEEERPARRWLGGLPALAATLVIILLTVAIFGIPGLFPGLRKSAAQPPNLAGITLTSISMVSASEGWAVGAPFRSLQNIPPPYGSKTNGPPVILHYHNGQWNEESLPVELNNPQANYVLRSISMDSSSEGWAVGSSVLPGKVDVVTQGILLHYTGGRWVMANDHLGVQLQQVFMRSATDGWIVGESQANDPAGYMLVLHYDGHVWHRVESLLFANQPWFLQSVVESPDGEVWISGFSLVELQGSCTEKAVPGVIFHYDGSQWTSISVTPAGISLSTVMMVSSSDGWAVGFQQGGILPGSNCIADSSIPDQGVVMHYQHGQWQEVAQIAGDGETGYFTLSGLAMVSASEGWAVGSQGTIVHYHNGVWAKVASPIVQERGLLYSVVMVSATEGWAVGDFGTILHYHNGAWSVVANTPPQPAPTSTPQLNLSQYSLHNISMISPTEGWAVGNTRPPVIDPTTGQPTQDRNIGGDPIILHYHQGRWTPDALPDFKGYLRCGSAQYPCPLIALNGISMVSASEGWAVGNTVLPIIYHGVVDGFTIGLLLHYRDGKWTLVDVQAAKLSSIVMLSATDGWIIGGGIGSVRGVPGQYVALHYDGHSWTPVSDPMLNNIAPISISATTDGQVWVSGVDYSASVGSEDGNEPAVLLHYDGQHWSKIDPHVANARLSGLFFGSPDEGWAVGTLPNTDQHGPAEEDGVILHYSNGGWQEQSVFKNPFGHQFFSFSSVAMASPDEGWAVGDEGIILHYHNGAWSEFQNPTSQALYSVVMVSSGEGWAVGDGVIVHYQAGSWRVYNG